VIVAALVPAAGSGSRLGADLPKAFVPLEGRTLLERAVDALRAGGVDRVVVALPPDVALPPALAGLPWLTGVPGGATRSQSVAAALAAVGDDVDVVLVHDAARALAPSDLVARMIAAISGDVQAAVPAIPVVDTLRVASDDLGRMPVDRDRLVAVQTPQAFTASVLRAAHAQAAEATDDAQLVQAIGHAVTCVPGDRRAFKITDRFDFDLARAMVDR
jgi:2-C-methyl-D-erythritol 4-phosphate cytidylyltransferase